MKLLETNKEMKERYNIIIHNRYNAIEKISSIDEQWQMLKESIQQTSKEIIPEIKKTAKKKWMTEEILKMMELRRKSKHNEDEYNRIHK